MSVSKPDFLIHFAAHSDAAKEKYEKVAAISAFENITDGDEAALRAAIARQPVSVAVRANCDSFRNYGGGVLDDDCGGGENQIDHAVLAVGYNPTALPPYYIVKNSWGANWGMLGHGWLQAAQNGASCKLLAAHWHCHRPPRPPR